jgi:hypothetical protein
MLIPYSAFRNLRLTFTQSLFFNIDNLQLYQFHKTDYTGFTKMIFDKMNFFDSNQWSFLPFGINDYAQSPFNNYPYNFFTNEKYLEVQQTDSLLYSSQKPFLIITFPFVFTVFFVCNRLFYLLFGY